MTEFPNWFDAYARPLFEKHLLPLAGQVGLQFLQLGVYTGDATQWLCENVLLDDSNWLHDVDTWEGSDEQAHQSIDFNEIKKIYQSRIAARPVTSWVSTTINYLLNTARNREDTFDFIYIDADHTAVGVLLDAELSFPLLKSGGLLAFDDYQWGADLPASKSPKLGIDLFLERHEGEYELLEKGLQVWICKI